MKRAGVWLDRKGAMIFKFSDGPTHKEFKLVSGIEPGRVKGGAKANTLFGAQDSVSESKVLEKKKHQTSAFFKRITDRVRDCDEITIAGPGQTKTLLQKQLESRKDFAEKLISSERMDKFSKAQIAAHFKKLFRTQV